MEDVLSSAARNEALSNTIQSAHNVLSALEKLENALCLELEQCRPVDVTDDDEQLQLFDESIAQLRDTIANLQMLTKNKLSKMSKHADNL